MRTKFWRKRNAKLDVRLDTVIETTERARKSIQLPPSRVTIDTSYVAALDAEATLHPEVDRDVRDRPHGLDASEIAAAEPSEIAALPDSDVEATAQSSAEAAGRECDREGRASDAGPSAGLPTVEGVIDPGTEHMSEEGPHMEALLRRAEEAERELEAVYRAAEQQELAARETFEALQREIEARRAAEDAHDAVRRQKDENAASLDILRAAAEAREESLSRANAALEAELGKRRVLEQERDELSRLVDDVKQGSLTASTVGADRLREVNQALERETAGRTAAEASRDAMEQKLHSMEAELMALRAGDASHLAKLRELTDASARETAARVTAEAEVSNVKALLAAGVHELAEAEEASRVARGANGALEADLAEARRRIDALQNEVAALRAAGEQASTQTQAVIEKERQTLERRIEAAELRVSQSDAEAERYEAVLREVAEARDLEAEARRAAEAERDAWAQRAADAATDVDALKSALEERAAVADRMIAPPMQAIAAVVVPAAAGVADEADSAVPPRRMLDPAERLRSVARSMRKATPDDANAADEASRLPVAVAVEREPEVAPMLPVPHTGVTETPATGSAADRRDRRVTSQMPATLWREGMGQPLSCTLRDRSSSGARVEFKHAAMIEGFSAFNVGDQATLTLNSAHEKTWVGCEIAWVDGNSCGVRFLGQFRSEGPVTRKSLRNAPAEKAPRAKAGSKLASVFSLRGS